MKVGILTLPLNDNIGGILQAYALRNVLLQMGHEVVHVERHAPSAIIYSTSSRFYSWWYTRRLVKGVIFAGNKKLKEDHRNAYRLWASTQGIRIFVKKHIPRKVLSNYTAEGFDCLVVGSDQIWRPVYYPKIEDAFLSFASNDKQLKKIAYAPSFGVDDWEYSEEQTERCGALLKQFSAVSVREESGVRLCEEKFGVEARHLIDPTMLLTKEHYMELVGVTNLDGRSNRLLSYVLDATLGKEEGIAKLCKEKGVQHVPIKRSRRSIEEWLRGFMEAEFVFTDSFHGCVFAILFHKPFIAFGNKVRGLSRFTSLLRKFKLEHRLIMDSADIAPLIEDKICWEEVDSLLEEERQSAMDFLKTNMETNHIVTG